MAYFENTIIWLEEIGVADVIVPFFLVFTLVFAILQKTALLGHEKKNFNVIIALMLGLAVVFPHVTGNYPTQYDIVDIMNKALPQVSLLIVAVMMILLLIGLFGGEANWVGGTVSGIIALIAFILVIYIFGAAANFWTYIWWLDWLRDSDTQAMIIVLLVFGLVVWFITKEDRDKSPGEGLMSGLGNLFMRGGKGSH